MLFHISDPFGHTARTDFRSRKEMYVIRHQDIMPYVPAIVIGRALPDFVTKPSRIAAKPEF